MKLRILLLLTIVILLIVYLFPNEPARPYMLYGTWRTKTPPYTNAILDISSDKIVFSNGSGYTDANKITSIKKVNSAGEFLYNIHYKSVEGSKSTLFLYYSYPPERGRTIRLKNKKHIVWYREEDM